MIVRSILLRSVCSAWLAATAAVGVAQAAENPSVQLASAAYQSLTSGDTADAIAKYSEAIESRELPTDALANALLNRALAYQKSGQFQDAIDDYAAALRIDALGAKLRATALYNRGLAYQKIDRPALAIEDFTSALFLDSEFSYCYYSRGVALRDSGQFLFALSDFEKARRYNHPQPHLVYYGEALVYEALKRPDDAAKSLRKALALKPDFAPALKHLSGLGVELPAAGAETEEADGLTTGSISIAGGTQIIGGDDLPQAVKPPDALLPAVATPAASVVTVKKYTDRIPQEEPAQATLVSATTVQDTAVEVEVTAQTPSVADTSEATEQASADSQETIAASLATNEPALTSEPEPSASTTELTGWSVQLSSAKNEKAAWGIWDKLKAKHKVLADQKPIVVKADLGTKGIFYRLRLAGFTDSSSAAEACSKLKSKGIKCYVSRINS
jgi:tetratricopeptide (TPR) repeat protein